MDAISGAGDGGRAPARPYAPTDTDIVAVIGSSCALLAVPINFEAHVSRRWHSGLSRQIARARSRPGLGASDIAVQKVIEIWGFKQSFELVADVGADLVVRGFELSDQFFSAVDD
ncbi:hypothetical protein [Mesorhizobium amorphae]|uniref:hypothetical protein n=1 Tax=Mesorhizobium amorphae TaxID=71433 RepID=UPI00177E9D98